jgi:DNA polymerase III subunit gamma/tau
MLRMLTFRPQVPESQQAQPKPVVIQAPALKTDHAVTTAVVAAEKTVVEAPPVTRPAVSSEPRVPSENWSEIIAALNIGGRTRELANNCVLDSIDDHVCRLLIDASFQRVGTIAEEKLREALQKYYGRPLKLQITPQINQQMTPAIEMQKAREDKQQAAVDAINTDPNIQALKDNFEARIMPGSIEPLN